MNNLNRQIAFLGAHARNQAIQAQDLTLGSAKFAKQRLERVFQQNHR